MLLGVKVGQNRRYWQTNGTSMFLSKESCNFASEICKIADVMGGVAQQWGQNGGKVVRYAINCVKSVKILSYFIQIY